MIEGMAASRMELQECAGLGMAWLSPSGNRWVASALCVRHRGVAASLVIAREDVRRRLWRTVGATESGVVRVMFQQQLTQATSRCEVCAEERAAAIERHLRERDGIWSQQTE